MPAAVSRIRQGGTRGVCRYEVLASLTQLTSDLIMFVPSLPAHFFPVVQGIPSKVHVNEAFIPVESLRKILFHLYTVCELCVPHGLNTGKTPTNTAVAPHSRKKHPVTCRHCCYTNARARCWKTAGKTRRTRHSWTPRGAWRSTLLGRRATREWARRSFGSGGTTRRLPPIPRVRSETTTNDFGESGCRSFILAACN